MSRLIVRKSEGLFGETAIQGSKNAALPIIAAALLVEGQTVIRNCPDISDVRDMMRIITGLGCMCELHDNILMIDSGNVTGNTITDKAASKIRSSVILAGALLGRCGEVSIAYPGGCNIGERKLDIHLEMFRKLGYYVDEGEDCISMRGKINTDVNIRLPFKSVGATENGIISSVISDDRLVIIDNAAREPEIVNLCRALNDMGACIHGAGTDRITIRGVKELRSSKVLVDSDRIVAGTYIAAAAAAGGNITIKNVKRDFDSAILNKFREFGVRFRFYQNEIAVISHVKDSRKADITISTAVYPGFPTDMQSIIMAVMTKRADTGVIVENIFENRLKNVEMLNRMGAQITLVDERTAYVSGVEVLRGTTVRALDLRSGAALVVAGLMAEGYTMIEDAEYIERGYEHIDTNMRNLSAKVEYDVAGTTEH